MVESKLIIFLCMES